MQVRVGVIGAGHYAVRSHIPNLARRPEVVLQAVCRPEPDLVTEIADRFGFRHAFTTAEETLSAGVDAVVVASPHHLHHAHAKAALQAGANVLVEKPMCLDPADAWDLVATAERLGRHLLVANGWHYRPGLDTVRDWAAELGAIEHVLCHMASSTRAVFEGPGGKVAFADQPVQPDRATWQDRARGGGFAWGQLSHALALMTWAIGCRVTAAQAITWSGRAGVDLHDAAILRLAGGGIASVSGSCGLPEPHRSEVDLRVYGENGALALDLDRERLVLRTRSGIDRHLDVALGAWDYDCVGPIDALVDLTLGRGRNHSPGEIGAVTVETLDAISRSAAADGEPVAVSRSSIP